MNWIYELSYDQLSRELMDKGLKKFAVDQISQWIYSKNIQDIQQWSNISKVNRELLTGLYDTALSTITKVQEDNSGTKKILVTLTDGSRIEAVLIGEKDHFTFCISSQVGCALGCKFCATGKLGFKRNLSPGEILSQILLLKKYIPQYKGKLNLVFMGMGEPMLNYQNLKQALEIITSEKGIGISPRNITVSTAGILKRLQRFERDFPRIKVSFSLNAPSSSIRKEVMPITRKEPLEDFLDHFKSIKRKHRVTFEYVMLKGVNDSLEDARKLSALVRGIPCKINLIPYNENKGFPFKTPQEEQVDAFADFLHLKGYTVMVRWSKGRGINSACGQLSADG